MQIFLSHDGSQKELVRAVKNRLPEFLQSWLDDEKLQWSAPLKESLKSEINANSDFLIVFLGPNTLTSKWVKMELQWALDREKELGRAFVLPVVMAWNKERKLPPELRGRLYLELGPGERAVQRLADDIVVKLFQLVIESATLGGGIPYDRKWLLKALRDGPSRIWLRPMLKQPLPNPVFDNLLGVLQEAVKLATQVIGTGKPKVRANIFLPRSQNINSGEVCTLSIPERHVLQPTRLQFNMQNPAELNIFFRPNEGATGKVYADEKSVGRVVHPKWCKANAKDRQHLARWVNVDLNPTKPLDPLRSILESEIENTDTADTELNDYINVLVDPHLTWIVSTPINRMFNGRPEVIGTFSVDGLDLQIDPAVLRKIFYTVAPFAGVIGWALREEPVEHVAILKEVTS